MFFSAPHYQISVEVEPESMELVSNESQLDTDPDLLTVSQALRLSSALLRMSHHKSLSSLLSAESSCLRMVI